MKSNIGLQGVVIAEVTADEAGGATTYGDIEAVTGAIDMSVTPSTTDPDVQYADDVEWDVLNPDPQLAVVMEWAQLPLSVQSRLGGHRLDKNGVMIETAGDTAPYYAIGGKSELRDGGYRYFWLLKCRAKPVTENYHTKEGETITRQTSKVEFTAIKRTSDNQYRYKADEGKNGFTAEMGKTFLSSVYTPDIEADAS